MMATAAFFFDQFSRFFARDGVRTGGEEGEGRNDSSM